MYATTLSSSNPPVATRKVITVVAVDDHHLIRDGIRAHIEKDNGLSLVGEGVCGKDLFNLVEQYKPDVLILDIKMSQDVNNPVAGPFQILPAIRVIRRMSPDTAILILSAEVSHALVEMGLARGILGYLLKEDELTNMLPQAIRTIHNGGIFFSKILLDRGNQTDSAVNGEVITKRQKQLILAIAEHPELSYAQHGANFGITEGTVKNHLTDLFRRVGVDNIKACILECIKRGIIVINNLQNHDESHGV